MLSKNLYEAALFLGGICRINRQHKYEVDISLSTSKPTVRWLTQNLICRIYNYATTLNQIFNYSLVSWCSYTRGSVNQFCEVSQISVLTCPYIRILFLNLWISSKSATQVSKSVCSVNHSCDTNTIPCQNCYNLRYVKWRTIAQLSCMHGQQISLMESKSCDIKKCPKHIREYTHWP